MLTNRANDHVGRRGGLSLLLCIRMLLMLCDDVYVTMAIGDGDADGFEINSGLQGENSQNLEFHRTL